MNISHIGLNIKLIRKKWKVTQEEFGEMLGGTRGMIMQYENNNVRMNERMLAYLSSLTGISREDLIIKEISEDEIRPLSAYILKALEKYRNGLTENLVEYVSDEYLHNTYDTDPSNKIQDNQTELTNKNEKSKNYNQSDTPSDQPDALDGIASYGLITNIVSQLKDEKSRAIVFLLYRSNIALQGEIDNLRGNSIELSQRYIKANRDFIKTQREFINVLNKYDAMYKQLKELVMEIKSLNFRYEPDKEMVLHLFYGFFRLEELEKHK